MKNWNMIAAAALLALLPAGVASSQQKPEPGQHAQVLEKQITIRLNYLLFLPEDYGKDPEKKWPLILFLHGSGERGDDISKVKTHGPPKIVEQKKDFPFIVVSPQCPADGWWNPLELNALLESVMAANKVDPDRVYLTGLSMGGFGVWDMIARYPHRFAAIAPVCGAGNLALVRRSKDIPTWVFHGDKDTAVPVERSDEMVAALKKAGADVKYTRYEGVGHDCWTATYDNKELYDWFLAHKRVEKKPAEKK